MITSEIIFILQKHCRWPGFTRYMYALGLITLDGVLNGFVVVII